MRSGQSLAVGTPDTCPAWPTKRGFDYFFGYNNHLAGHRHYPKEESNADPETHCNAVWDGDELITVKPDKGWVEKTCIAIDERVDDMVREAMRLVRENAPSFRIASAVDKPSELTVAASCISQHRNEQNQNCCSAS